ncbi:hypothetical protein ACQUFY_24250 [Robbsia andropogonis]|uniref:hypothetical protein n=1 Tax=Robbsia andropogonis TaxID=28092 RepID=UPI003D1E183B
MGDLPTPLPTEIVDNFAVCFSIQETVYTVYIVYSIYGSPLMISTQKPAATLGDIDPAGAAPAKKADVKKPAGNKGVPVTAQRKTSEAKPDAPKATENAQKKATKVVHKQVKTSPKPKAKTVKTANAEVAVPDTSVGAPAKAKRAKKEKVVRDSFTMPKSEYAILTTLKQQCLDAGIAVKKSELLRAGLAALAAMPSVQLVAAVKALETVKTGRPAQTAS